MTQTDSHDQTLKSLPEDGNGGASDTSAMIGERQ